MAERLRPRRDIAASYTASNVVMRVGEFGYETDTSRLKIGDGATPWNSLLYFGQISPQFIAGFTFAQASATSFALAVANPNTQIIVTDRGVAGRPAYSDGIDFKFYDTNATIT